MFGKFLAAGVLLTGLALSGAQAQTIDKNGRCHSPDGKFAKMEVCKSPDGASCRDKTTKNFVKNDAANTEKVPSKVVPK